mmetsp:Transcript_19750/g.29124  ORF Transcript_19750/g.29124 Transcript_19750/m.29124 type:complete len:519 (+) Transcript_19750:203-1759(+)
MLSQKVKDQTTHDGRFNLSPEHIFISKVLSICLLLHSLHLLINLVRWDLNVFKTSDFISSHGSLKVINDIGFLDILVLDEIFRSNEFLDFFVFHSPSSEFCHHLSILFTRLVCDKSVGYVNIHYTSKGLCKSVVTVIGPVSRILLIDSFFKLILESLSIETRTNGVGKFIVNHWNSTSTSLLYGNIKHSTLSSKSLVPQSNGERNVNSLGLAHLSSNQSLYQTCHVTPISKNNFNIISTGSIRQCFSLGSSILTSHVSLHINNTCISHFKFLSIRSRSSDSISLREILHSLLKSSLIKRLTRVSSLQSEIRLLLSLNIFPSNIRPYVTRNNHFKGLTGRINLGQIISITHKRGLSNRLKIVLLFDCRLQQLVQKSLDRLCLQDMSLSSLGSQYILDHCRGDLGSLTESGDGYGFGDFCTCFVVGSLGGCSRCGESDFDIGFGFAYELGFSWRCCFCFFVSHEELHAVGVESESRCSDVGVGDEVTSNSKRSRSEGRSACAHEGSCQGNICYPKHDVSL